MDDEARALHVFGTAQPVPAARVLRAGALRCEFSQGALRDVRWHGVEIVRGISYLLRDRDWGTVPATVADVALDESPARFVLGFTLRMTTPRGTLAAAARIEGDADGFLVFEARATPDADLETNRCGFVVLHPGAAAGRALEVEHTDGRRDDTRFPAEVSPAQPVLDIRALAYAPAHGVRLRVRLEADLPGDPAGKFEMEDQRNWSDASFKTYVASLLDPWPYVLPAGRATTQRVSVAVEGAPPDARASAQAPAIVLGAAGARRMPAIGVGVPPGIAAAGAHELAALRALGAGWWIVEAEFDAPGHGDDLALLAALRGALPVRVRLDAVVPADRSPADCAGLVHAAAEAAGLRVDAVRLLPRPYLKSFQPGDRWPDLPPLEAYAEAARARFPHAQVGGGMFTCFTELNRKRPRPEGLDFIGHATFPIVHAADDRALMQTMESLAAIHRSVRALWPGVAYHLGPSALAMRRNPYGDLPAPNPRGERLAMAAADPRHDALFGAAWTAAYAAAVAPLGVELLALHASHGASGPFGRRAPAAAPVPAWDMLRVLAEAAGAPIVPVDKLPDGVLGLAWQRADGRVEGIVVDVSGEPRTLRWRERDGASPRRLDAYEALHFRWTEGSGLSTDEVRGEA